MPPKSDDKNVRRRERASEGARDKGESERANELVQRMKFQPINTHYSSSHQRLTTALPLQHSHAASRRDASRRWCAGDAANWEVSAFHSGSQDARHRGPAHARTSIRFIIPAPFMIPIDRDERNRNLLVLLSRRTNK